MTSTYTLYVKEANGRYKVATKEQALFSVRAMHYIEKGMKASSPQEVKPFLTAQFEGEEHERFAVMFLDKQNLLISFRFLFTGTVDACAVYPREVVKRALELNAAALILAHNHPSGDPTPSAADLQMTQKLKEACALMDIDIIDHIIVGTRLHSMAEHRQI